VRDFTWHVFRQTGDIEAYLLYKEVRDLGASDIGAELGSKEDEGQALNEE
jgi:hypothetical protein